VCASLKLLGTIVRDLDTSLIVGMMADISGTDGRSEEADCISEKRGMHYHTQMHYYPARKGTAVLYKVTVLRA
jgi:hypothetical protein